MGVSNDSGAVAIYKDAVVIDGLQAFWYQPDFPAYLPKVVDSGLTALNHTLTLPYDFMPDSLEQLVRKVAVWEKRSAKHSDSMLIVGSTNDILRAKKEGKVGVIHGLQNAYPVGDEPDLVWALHRLGIFQN